MKIELAEERVLVLADPASMELAENRAWLKRVEAFGTVARMSGLLSRPKDEEYELTYKERRLQPFWRIAARATYAYQRRRDYKVKVAPEVRSVVVDGEARPVSDGAFALSGEEICREEHQREFLFDGAAKETRGELAVYLKHEGAPASAADLAGIAADGTIIAPPEAKASMVIRQVVAAMVARIDADKVTEETVCLERVDLTYRPVYAFRYRRAGKEAVVEYDPLTGAARPGGATFETYLGKVLEPRFLFDVTVETANIFLPGATLARVILDKGLEFKKR